jgi:hypothetical protein
VPDRRASPPSFPMDLSHDRVSPSG